MSQEMTYQENDQSLLTLPNQYAASTGSETSADDLSECSDTALMGASNFIMTGRKRRRRTIIATDQLLEMEQLYKVEQWPGREKKEALARDIGMSSHFVNIWFQNKRSRMKKLAQEEEELALLHKTRSPGTGSLTLNPAPSVPVPAPSVCPKPVAIAPKPPGIQTGLASSSSSSMSPISAGRMPTIDNVQVKQCLLVGQSINLNGADTAVSSCKSTQAVKVLADSSPGEKCSRIQCAPSQQPATLLRLLPHQVNPLLIPAGSAHRQAQLPRQQTPHKQMNFFKCLVSMMAMEEGGLLKKGDAEFDVAVNAALYGLRIANDNILTYKKKEGLVIHSDRP